jgi:polyphosphate kinase
MVDRVPKKAYERELTRLQTELVNMQEWVKAQGKRVVVIFEGRDAAGKGSTIKRVSEYLNPRVTRIVALPAPTERVMGFCTSAEYRRFLHQAPIFERLLVEDGIQVLKYWFSVSDVEQEKRFRSRAEDPMRRWKLSPMDLESITRWEDYSRAKDEMFVHTDIPEAPWHVVESEDKRASRINMIAHLLSVVPYRQIEQRVIEVPPRPPSTGYERPPREDYNYVPEYSRRLMDDVPKDKKKDRAKVAAS